MKLIHVHKGRTEKEKELLGIQRSFDKCLIKNHTAHNRALLSIIAKPRGRE